MSASNTETAPPTHRRGTRGVGKRQLERHAHDVSSRSAQDQLGAEGALGKAEDSQAEAHDLSGGSQKDSGGAESTVGKGEARKEGSLAGRSVLRPVRPTPKELLTKPHLLPMLCAVMEYAMSKEGDYDWECVQSLPL